jgi:hypothetical protein
MEYTDIVKTYIAEAEDMANSASLLDALNRMRRLNWWLNQARAYEMRPDFPQTQEQRTAYLALSDWLIDHAMPSPNVAEYVG